MAKSEYVKLAPTEIFYGQKNLLESHLGIANLLKQIKLFHEIRKEELLLKLELKRKFEEIKFEIMEFNKLLPRTASDELPEIKPKIQLEIPEEELSLEREIQGIKQKLASLRT